MAAVWGISQGEPFSAMHITQWLGFSLKNILKQLYLGTPHLPSFCQATGPCWRSWPSKLLPHWLALLTSKPLTKAEVIPFVPSWSWRSRPFFILAQDSSLNLKPANHIHHLSVRRPFFPLIISTSSKQDLSCLESPNLSSIKMLILVSVQFSSVAQSCPTLCDPMNCSMPGLPVHHQLPEFTQTHIHWVHDAIPPSHPLSSPSPPAFNLSQHQGLFKWISSSYQVAKLLVEARFSPWTTREVPVLVVCLFRNLYILSKLLKTLP